MNALPHRFSPHQIRSLVEQTKGPFVSIYLPMEHTFPDVKKNLVIYRQAVQKASEDLAAAGLSRQERASWKERLDSVETDIREMEPPPSGIAVFLDPSDLRSYMLFADIRQSVYVGEYLVIRPLIHAAHLDRRFRLLALSTNRVVLFQGDAATLRPVALSGLPSSMKDALGSELAGRQIQFRSSAMRGRGPSSHGQGGAGEERSLDLYRFHSAVANALEKSLRDDLTPLVLATDASHEGEFRSVAKLPTLLAESLHGNTDHLSTHQLHERAWPIVLNAIRVRDQEVKEIYEHARNRGKAVDLLGDVAAGAVAGRLRRLWLEAGRSEPGEVDPETGRLNRDPDIEKNILDQLAVIALRRGSDCHVLDAENMPTKTGAAAELH